MPDPLISVNGLGLERGGRALLQGFDLDVSAGDLLLIEGANGSGKTTLLRALAGLSSLGQTGRITRHCNGLLYLGHRPGIKQLLTPRENLSWVCASQGWDSTGIDTALERVGLAGHGDNLCQHLSAGQQRRVNLARLYLSFEGEATAVVWLLDEPFTAIDRTGVHALTETIAAQVARGGAVILTSHQDLPFKLPLRRVLLGVEA
jgi:heme exporter protein A